MMSDTTPIPRRPQCHWLPLLAAVVCLASPAAAAAQDVPPLTDRKLEDLLRLDVQRVFGASERLQPVTEAPSSVTIVTADEIARYGYRTLADVLRGVRGLYVSDDRQYSFLGVRGLSRPGDFDTRVLLLVNGHPVNDNVYSQAQIGSEFGIDASMFERVEVIRGPASSLYGTGAFLAVVNVITRSGASLHGASVAVETGSLETRLMRAAAGQRFASGIDVAVSATHQQTGGVQRLYIPAFDSAATNQGIAAGLDGERVSQLYGHLGFKDFTLTAAYGHRDKDVATAPYGGAFNVQAPRSENFDRRTLLDALYEHSARGTHVTLRGSFDRYDYNAINPFPGVTAGAPPIVNYDVGVGTRLGFDGRVTRSFRGQHTVTAGTEFFDNLQQNMANHDDNLPGTIIDQTSRQGALYLQDAVRLKPWLLVNGGLRYDRYQSQADLTPSAAVIFLPSSNQSFKYLYGQAFRAPNAFERSYYSAGIPNRSLRAESIDTHEVVWERYTAAWLRTSVSAYRYTARELITFQPDPEGVFGLTFANGGTV